MPPPAPPPAGPVAVLPVTVELRTKTLMIPPLAGAERMPPPLPLSGSRPVVSPPWAVLPDIGQRHDVVVDVDRAAVIDVPVAGRAAVGQRHAGDADGDGRGRVRGEDPEVGGGPAGDGELRGARAVERPVAGDRRQRRLQA